MEPIAQGPREETFRRMMRLLAKAGETAGELALPEVARLVDMAILGVVAEWDGIDPALAGDAKLEAAVKVRRRQATDCRAGAAVYRMEQWRLEPPQLPAFPRGPKLVE